MWAKEFCWSQRSEELILPDLPGDKLDWEGDRLTSNENAHAGYSTPLVLAFREGLDAERVKFALGKTLSAYPLLASRLEQDEHGHLHFTKELSGALLGVFDVEVSKGARSLDEFFDNGGIVERLMFQINAVSSKYVRVGTSAWNMNAPLVCVQLSYFSTGECLLAINACHAVGDAGSMAIFIKTLNSFCSSAAPLVKPTYSRKRVLMQVKEEKEAKRMREDLKISPQWEDRWLLFPRFALNMAKSLAVNVNPKIRVNTAKLTALKEEINKSFAKGTNNDWISSTELLTCILLGGLAIPSKYANVSMMTNMRARSRYIPDPNYIGDAATNLALDAALFDRKVTSSNIGRVALDFHHILRGLMEKDVQSKTLDYLDYRQANGKTDLWGLWNVYRDPRERHICVNSWTTFQQDYFSCTFGGKQTPFRAPFVLGFEGVIKIIPEYGNGDWSVNMSVTKKEYTKFLGYLAANGWDQILIPTHLD